MADEKSEEATPRRLKKAREEGDSGVSAFAAQALAFLAVTAVLPGAIRALAVAAATDVRVAIARSAAREVSAALDPGALAAEVLTLAAPVMLVAAIASAVALVVQTGGLFATKRVTPDLARLDLVQGLRQIVSGARLFAVARALVAAGLVAWIAARLLSAHASDLARSIGQTASAAVVAGALATTLARDTALLGVGIGLFDLLVVRRGWKKRLRMSKDEVRREARESEGDPHVKAARHQAHQELLASATLASIRTASVVIVNPTHLACALRYAAGDDDAPVVVAAGEGDMAARIVRAARELGVPVVQDVPLARALRELEIGDQIPEALYEAVAEILREVWEREGGGS